MPEGGVPRHLLGTMFGAPHLHCYLEGWDRWNPLTDPVPTSTERAEGKACCSCLDTPEYPVCLLFSFRMNSIGEVWWYKGFTKLGGFVGVGDNIDWQAMVRDGYRAYCLLCAQYRSDDDEPVDADIIWHAGLAGISLFLCNRHSCELDLDHARRPHARKDGAPCRVAAQHIASIRIG